MRGKREAPRKNVSVCVYFSCSNSIYTCLMITSNSKEGIQKDQIRDAFVFYMYQGKIINKHLQIDKEI